MQLLKSGRRALSVIYVQAHDSILIRIPHYPACLFLFPIQPQSGEKIGETVAGSHFMGGWPVLAGIPKPLITD
jgi:hypothetical protein